MTTLETYPLGYSEAEAKRLAEQGGVLEDLSGDLLRRAGLSEGMRVLDLGCGVATCRSLRREWSAKKGRWWESIGPRPRSRSRDAVRGAARAIAGRRTSPSSRPTS
jgi:hypothetical protein